ncbi:galactosylceramide sulfotransferase-like isoform X1 [Stylophora pistillata]|uniref:galactosylceramide sulfotransferase-like isoform X1 n=1 Tax=Stylophora pistillata TaxID=50429 RepID=UPI000C04D816|nr:galactosylceramide sulfotransferase-like isoform X1 [Stylophora pistillata]
MRIFHRGFLDRLLWIFLLLSVIYLLYTYSQSNEQEVSGIRQVIRHMTKGDALGMAQEKKGKCFPVQHILFLKTHKTGSSTMANIFFRYGNSKNLTFVLSPGTLLGWPHKFHITHPLRLFSKAPNILCSHARFNKEPMNWLFPKETSKYVTILRNPVDNFESVFNFAQLGKSLGFGDNLDGLERFLTKGIDFNRTHNGLMSHLARNPMMFDLGLNYKFYQNLTAVQKYVRFLDKEFDLVMIMDYFDESLVLMKRLLCWELEDILYVKLNARLDKEIARNLSKTVQENIKRWNMADVLLFDHFNATFWRKVKMEGPSFNDDLIAFRRRKEETKRLCLKDEMQQERAYHEKFVKGYLVRNDLTPRLKVWCGHFVRKENSFLDYLRKTRLIKLRNAGLDKFIRVEKETDWNIAKDLQYKPITSTQIIH